MDFRDACRIFARPDFDGDPIQVEDESETSSITYPTIPISYGNCNAHDHCVKWRVNGVEFKIVNERVQYYDKDGKLIIESVTDHSKKNILGEYATLDDFLKAWNTSERKQAITDALKERGVLLNALREAAGNRDIDDFDLICHIAFDKKPLTKAERAANVRKRDYLNKYEGLARDVLSALLDKYASNGIADLEQIEILQVDPFRKFGAMPTIFEAFGGKQSYLEAVKNLQNKIYTAVA
jgi:type I restriction enzyme R subunit